MNPEDMPPDRPADYDNVVPGPGYQDQHDRDATTWAALDKAVKKGEQYARKCRRNMALILHMDPRWKGRLRWNEMDATVYLDGEPINDDLEGEIGMWMDKIYGPGFDWSPMEAGRIARIIAKRDSYHPVREWLEGLEWDGKPRLKVLLFKYLGCEKTALHATMGRKWAMSAVARAMDPGTKVDHTLILTGSQGAGKSTALAVLAYREEWFSDSMLDLRNKDAYQSIQGVWIYELAELDSVNRRDSSNVKAFLTARVDKYRKSYGRNDERVPRSCIFVGTTNEAEFLNDPTGSRRFWPVKTGKIALKALEDDRDQIWAEAVAAWKTGEDWWLSTKDAKTLADGSVAYERVDPWQGAVHKWASGRTEAFKATRLLIEVFEMSAKDCHTGHTRRVGAILQRMGFEKKSTTGEDGKGWYWEKE